MHARLRGNACVRLLNSLLYLSPTIRCLYCIISFFLNLPNIQISLAIVNLLKLIDSGAIHFMGSFPFEATTQLEQKVQNHVELYLCMEGSFQKSELKY